MNDENKIISSNTVDGISIMHTNVCTSYNRYSEVAITIRKDTYR